MFSMLTSPSDKMIKWVANLTFLFIYNFVNLVITMLCSEQISLQRTVCLVERFCDSDPAGHTPHVGALEAQA